MLNWKKFLFHCIRQEDTEESYNLNFGKFHSNYQTFVHNLLSAKFVDESENDKNNDTSQLNDVIDLLPKEKETNSRKSSVSIEEEHDSCGIFFVLKQTPLNLLYNFLEASRSSPDLLTPMYFVPYIDAKKNKRKLCK